MSRQIEQLQASKSIKQQVLEIVALTPDALNATNIVFQLKDLGLTTRKVKRILKGARVRPLTFESQEAMVFSRYGYEKEDHEKHNKRRKRGKYAFNLDLFFAEELKEIRRRQAKRDKTHYFGKPRTSEELKMHLQIEEVKEIERKSLGELNDIPDNK